MFFVDIMCDVCKTVEYEMDQISIFRNWTYLLFLDPLTHCLLSRDHNWNISTTYITQYAKLTSFISKNGVRIKVADLHKLYL